MTLTGRTLLALAVSVGLGASAAPAGAETTAPRAPSKERVEGDYAGPAPGVPSRAVREGRAKAKAPKKGTLTWVGFTPKEGGAAEVWLQAA
ncbi:MAG: hypothetical protein R2939_11865, partial [Kofleriaceae bacterium]